MIPVPHLEWHITHSCNFTCQGCGHYTNDGYKQNIDLETLRDWYLLWNKKIRPSELSMLGGEPFLNKDIVNIIYMTKDVWNIQDDQEYEIVSNGLLFDRIEGLSEAMIDTDCILTITKHSQEKNYLRLFDKAIKSIEESRIKYRIYDMTEEWLKPYDGYGKTIEPICSDDYKSSWDHCPTGQQNFTLENGKIYKCSSLAYLPMQKRKYGDELSSKWDPYLKYKPLLPTDTQLDVLEFFIRSAEPVCSMCPKNRIPFRKETPLHSPRYVRNLYE